MIGAAAVVLLLVGALALGGREADSKFEEVGSAIVTDDTTWVGGDAGTAEGSSSESFDHSETSPTTTAPASTTTSTTEPSLLPDVGSEQMRADIESLLLEFHQALVVSDFDTAWSLFSERKRESYLTDPEKGGRPGFDRNQGSLSPYLSPSGIHVEVLEADPQTGEATVMVTGMGWSEPGATCSEWSGITWVLFENGVWRYDPGYSTTPERDAKWGPRVGELLGTQC